MRKVFMVTLEELKELPKITSPHPIQEGIHYLYVNIEGRTFIVTKLHSSGFIETLPVVIE